MKRYINIACAMIAVLLASCNNNNPLTNDDDNLRPMTISVITDHIVTRAATSSVAHYAISVWEDKSYTTPAPVFSDGNNYAANTSGSFSMVLNSTKSYYCLFWADNGTDYTLDNELKNIVLKDGSKTSEAFCGKTTIPAGTSTTYTANLKRAVAKITLKETHEMPADNTMAVTFDRYTAFNVENGEVTAPKTYAFTWKTTAKTGTSTSPVQLNDEDIFTLAPVEKALLSNIIFQCNEEGKITVSNVPLQANYNTSIKGHYTTVSEQTFIVDCKDEWKPGEAVP